MNIRAGLLRPSAVWRQVMAQEGLDWVELASPEEVGAGEFSVLIAPSRTTPADVEAIAGYLAKGGAVLASASALSGLMEAREERLGFILADGGLSSVGVIDLEMDGLVPREANVLRTPRNTFAVFAGEWKGGVAVVLPFDAAEALTEDRAGFRRFYLNRDRLPWERVSLVAKGGVRGLLRDALVYLHRARGLPYVHTWYYPDGHPNTFVFRVDTDGAAEGDIESLHSLLEEFRIPATWFLDVKTQGAMLKRYREFAGHEIGVHCDEHRIFKTEAENRENIQRSLLAIRDAGMEPVGFAAPFGYWDIFLGNVIDELGFSYSSEFSWAYDSLPGNPVTPAGEYRTLQIPIHPVSVGVLRRAGCPPSAMAEYYASAAQRRMRNGDPMIFYHHPSHRETGVMRRLLSVAQAAGVPAMTMAAFAEWWKARGTMRVAVESRDGILHVNSEGGRGWISILTPDGRHALVPPASEIRMNELKAVSVDTPVVPEDILRAREWDFRERFGQFLLTMRSGL